VPVDFFRSLYGRVPYRYQAVITTEKRGELPESRWPLSMDIRPLASNVACRPSACQTAVIAQKSCSRLSGLYKFLDDNPTFRNHLVDFWNVAGEPQFGRYPPLVHCWRGIGSVQDEFVKNNRITRLQDRTEDR